MKTIEYSNMDTEKLEWSDGEWRDEPDKVQFQDKTTRYPCLIVRNRMGALCGYVGIPQLHPLYEKDYNDTVTAPKAILEREVIEDKFPIIGLFVADAEDFEKGTIGVALCFDVHGGITFSSRCHQGEESRSICHIAGEGEDDKVWWFGFDCGHGGDIVPSMEFQMSKFRSEFMPVVPVDTYRNIEYVKNEIKSLARQLKMWEMLVGTENPNDQ